MSSVTSGRILFSLAVVTFAFFLNMSAYMCLEGLQSTINPGAGTYSLSVAYATVVLSSFFLPTVAMNFLKHSHAIGAATLGYAIYSAANCYPKPYILISASIVLGCSGAVIWAAGRVYVSDLATAYARLKGVNKDKTTAHFFGIFLAFVSSSLLVLTGVSSLVLQAAMTHPVEAASDNETTTNVTKRLADSHCGIHNCEYELNVEENNSNNATTPALTYDLSAMYSLFGVFAGTQVLAALFLFFGLTNITKDQNVETKMSDNKKKPEEIPMTSQDQDGSGEHLSAEVRQSSQRASERIRTHVISTGKFIVFNHAGQAMIPMTMHCGILQAFSFGQFTKYWVACYLGVEYIGFSISACGIGSIIGAYGGGFLTKFMPRWILIVVTLGIEMACGIFLLKWEPSEGGDSWVFFTIFGIIGLVYTTQKTITASVYSIFFGTEKEPANASLSIWDMCGTAVAYALSSVICNRAYVIGMLWLSAVGTIMYLFVERNYAKQQKSQN